MQRAQLDAYLDQYLEVARFRDYCPNGLQVEGRGSIERVVTGVTASIELIEAAIEARADALRERGERERLIGCAMESQLLLTEAPGDLESERACKRGVVADHGMRVERQVERVEIDVMLDE